MKVRAGVTTILRRPLTRSKPKEKNSLMRAEQTVKEMAAVPAGHGSPLKRRGLRAI
jgi:hypothetical protein